MEDIITIILLILLSLYTIWIFCACKLAGKCDEESGYKDEKN